MAIQSASATFTRFFVPDPLTEDLWSFVDEQLKSGAFRDLQEDEDKAKGFSSWDDLFDPSFQFASYHKGEYIAFSFRQDQRRVPPIVVKQHVRAALHKYLEEHAGHRPARSEYQRIREETERALLKRALPQPSACDVIWNPAGHWLLCGTTSSKTIDLLLEHFERFFHLYPAPLFHVNWASRMLPLNPGQLQALEALVPLGSAQVLEEGRFLGYEFLTWIWFFIEQNGGLLKIKDDLGVELALGERIILSRMEEGRERVICTTQASALHEARTALRQGKQVEEIQLFARTGSNDYLFTLDTDLGALKGVKTPKQLPDQEEDDPDAAFLEKMFFFEEIFAILEALFLKFLEQRLSSAWTSDFLPPLKQWITEGPTEDGGRES